MNLFLDTSAIIKLYHNEEGTVNLVKFLKQSNSQNLILTISELAEIEFRSAFLKRVRTKEIKINIVKEVFSDFDKDLNFINVVEIDRTIKEKAIELLNEHAIVNSLKTLDSLQLASAIIFNQNLSFDYFIASDQKLLEIARLYFKTYDPIKGI